MKNYMRNILIALDQFVGAFIPNSYPDETISSRAYREGWAIEPFINFVFQNPKHCEDSYWSEVNRRHMATPKGTHTAD